MTATTAPRLRMGNGFKVWHYSGALLHETNWSAGQELYEVIWQKYPPGVFQEQPISNVKVQGIVTATPQVSKAVYVPPGARGGGVLFSPRSAGDASDRSPIPGLPIGYKVSQSQQKKNRVRRKENGNGNTPILTKVAANGINAPADGLTKNENIKRNTPRPNNQNVANNNGPDTELGAEKPAPRKDRHRNRKTPRDANASDATTPLSAGAAGAAAAVKSPVDPEKEKRIKTIQKKLKNISKFKARKENGDMLEANQLSQIPQEAELVRELSTLKVAS